MLYFKLNKLPSFLLAFLGINTTQLDPILEKWVAYDTTPLDTEARKSIQADKEVDPLSEEFIDDNFEKYIDEKVLSKMKLSSTEEEGHPVHKITVDADSDLIDHLGKKLEEASRQKSNYAYPQTYSNEPEKLSDFIKNLKWEIYIDKKTYYTRKVIVQVDLEYDQSDSYGTFFMDTTSPLSASNKAKIAFAMKFDKFGEEVVVEEPSEFMTFEEFTNKLSDALNEIYGDAFTSSLAQSRDTKRKSDLYGLRNALEMYHVDCSKYPSSLSDMTHSAGSENCQNQTSGGIYIMSIPTDPGGSDYFYQTSENGASYSLCANLEVPPTNPNSCPDSSYNYHVTPTSFLY
ncbi:MAG: type II secretion system protein GspG [Patescibacteria group bacterium]|nr:type II secretion system protein GspG [Patescibacteria group bacterium]